MTAFEHLADALRDARRTADAIADAVPCLIASLDAAHARAEQLACHGHAAGLPDASIRLQRAAYEATVIRGALARLEREIAPLLAAVLPVEAEIPF